VTGGERRPRCARSTIANARESTLMLLKQRDFNPFAVWRFADLYRRHVPFYLINPLIAASNIGIKIHPRRIWILTQFRSAQCCFLGFQSLLVWRSICRRVFVTWVVPPATQPLAIGRGSPRVLVSAGSPTNFFFSLSPAGHS
jgi:hypothetical protein